MALVTHNTQSGTRHQDTQTVHCFIPPNAPIHSLEYATNVLRATLSRCIFAGALAANRIVQRNSLFQTYEQSEIRLY